MKILSWNVQGMGNPKTFRYLSRIARTQCPDFLFLMETNIGRGNSDRIRRRFTGYNIFLVDAIGKSGGLALLWKKDIKVNITSYSSNCINFYVEADGGGVLWRASGIYGWPEGVNKHLTWKLLREIRAYDNFPWVCFGDFNEICYST